MNSSFDHVALDYDSSFTNSEIGRLQRNAVWEYLIPILEHGRALEILELNCGTGEDTMLMMKYNHKIMATDASEKMITVAKSKINNSQNNKVQFVQASFKEISEMNFNKKFDLIFSNFGGLNCVDEKSLKLISQDVKKILKPKGKFIGVIMPKVCLWESFYFLSKFDTSNTFRRSKGKAFANLEGTFVETWYYSPKDFRRFMGSGFIQKKLIPIGILIPPSYLNDFFKKKIFLLKWLDFFEKILNRFSIFSSLSDHYLIELQYQK